MKFMPLFFGFIGYTFPAALVLYWTTSNFFQVGQQTILLRAGHIGPDAVDKRMAERREKQANEPPKEKKGLIAGLLARAEAERQGREGNPPKGGSAKGGRRPSGGKGPSGGSGGSGKGGSGGSKGSKPGQRPRPKKPGEGGNDASRG
jgi:YidC/Oxa1 family membrane protein insertase